MYRLSGDRSGLTGVLIAILIMILIIIAAIALFLVPFKTVNVNESRQVELAPGVRSLTVNASMDIGSMTIRFVNDSSEAASMSLVGTHRSGLFGPERPVNVSWAVANGTDSISIELNVSMGRNIGWFGSNDVRCDLNISNRLITSLTVKNSLGAVNVTTADGVVLTGLNIRASAGGIKADLTSGTTLDGPLRINTSLGGVDFGWTDLRATNNASVDLTASAGGVRLIIMQSSELGSNLTVRSTASLGGIDLNLDVVGNTSARVQSHAELGGVRVGHRSGFNGTDEDLVSTNYPSDHVLDVRSNASAGGINIRLNYRP